VTVEEFIEGIVEEYGVAGFDVLTTFAWNTTGINGATGHKIYFRRLLGECAVSNLRIKHGLDKKQAIRYLGIYRDLERKFRDLFSRDKYFDYLVDLRKALRKVVPEGLKEIIIERCKERELAEATWLVVKGFEFVVDEACRKRGAGLGSFDLFEDILSFGFLFVVDRDWENIVVREDDFRYVLNGLFGKSYEISEGYCIGTPEGILEIYESDIVLVRSSLGYFVPYVSGREIEY